jgi:putative transposase
VRLAYRAEIRPTPLQRQALLQHAGNARWAYNWGLRQHREAYEQWVAEGKPKKWKGWLNAISLHRDLNVLKKAAPEDGGVPWMYEASKAAPQEALRDLDRAFKNFLSGRAHYPRCKSRSRGIGGFRLTGTIKVDHRVIQLPVIGRVKFQPGEQGYLPWGKHAQVSVTEQAGRWFVSVVGPEVDEAAPNGNPEVGLDLGVVRLATLSDGTVIENPKALQRGQRKIKRLQQEVSRKKKGSANRNKARHRLAKAHDRVRNVRRDALHKATTSIATRFGRVIIEDLKVKNMTAGGGSRKRGLNRVVLDAAFGEFRRLLEYKGKLYGCSVEAVPPHYTSQRCSACGHVEKGNRRSQSDFRCLAEHCGHEANADLNAAINILEAASSTDSLNACGADVSRVKSRLDPQLAVKQEPGTSLRAGSDRGPSSQGAAAVPGFTQVQSNGTAVAEAKTTNVSGQRRKA